MTENRMSADMVRLTSDEPFWDCTASTGSFYIGTDQNGQRQMWFCLPDGNVGCINLRPIVPPNPEHPSWEWDGNEEKPTLTPSVHLPGRWHGWFRAGRMESC